MSKDEEFLLYPLDTGKAPICRTCEKMMSVASVEERGHSPSFVTFRCIHRGRTEKFICE
jgi:hypothetical protein